MPSPEATAADDGLSKTFAASALVLVCSLGGLLHATGGGQAFTTETLRRAEVAQAPRALPALRLIDDRGQQADLLTRLQADGRVRIVEFIYTRCTTVCVALAAVGQRLQAEIVARGLQDRVAVLSISFDPENDDARALRAYAARLRMDPAIWQAATLAEPADRRRLLDAFGIMVLPAPLGRIRAQRGAARRRCRRAARGHRRCRCARCSPRRCAGRTTRIATMSLPRRGRSERETLRWWRRGAIALAALAAGLSVPPLRSLIEQSMAWHMAVQMPLLVAAGWCGLSAVWPAAGGRALDAWNRYGLTGLLAALGLLAFWMLPSSVDRAVVSPGVDACKVLSLLLCGALLGHSVARAPTVVQLFFVGSALPMMIWQGVYLAATERRLCNAYTLDSQADAGRALAVLAVVVGLVWLVGVWRRAPAPRSSAPSTGRRQGID